MRRLRILLVVANDGPGGTQSQVKTQARALVAAGHDVTVAVGGSVTTLADDAYATRSLPAFEPRRPWRMLFALRRLRRELHADVVHGHPLRLAPLVAFSGARRRLVTCHGIDPDRVPRLFLRVVRWLPVRVVACGEGPQRQLAAVGCPSTLVNNATSPIGTPRTRRELLDRFDLRHDAIVALYPARFSRQKGHDRLLVALAACGDDRLIVIAAGEGPEREAVIAARDERGLTTRLLVTDWLEQAADWLAATDVFVVPSRWEGQPLIVLEALRAGLPVATCCPVGVEDLILEGRTGSIVASPDDLGRVLQQWTLNPSSRPCDHDAMRELLERHEPAVVVRQLELLYR